MLFRSISEDLRAGGSFRAAESGLRHILEHLRGAGVVALEAATVAEDRWARVLEEYDSHLVDVRGLCASSCEHYVGYARRLLDWYDKRHGGQPLSLLSGVDVLEFITEHASLHAGCSWRNTLCSQTRSFLRYLRWDGTVEVDLDRVVPKLLRVITIIDGERADSDHVR